MKKLLSLSSFLSFIIFLSFQTSFSSCEKDITTIDTITITKTDTVTKRDTLVITDTTVTAAILTANSWKTQELRGVIGNTLLVYERGATGNTQNYDNEYIHFNNDGTGTFFDAANSLHNITWNFLDSTDTKLTFIVYNPTPIESQTVIWENLRYKNNTILYDQYWTYEGLNSHAQSIRTPF